MVSPPRGITVTVHLNYGDSTFNQRGLTRMQQFAHGPPRTLCSSRHPATCDPARERARADILEDCEYANHAYLPAGAAFAGRAVIRPYCLMRNHVHISMTPSEEDG